MDIRPKVYIYFFRHDPLTPDSGMFTQTYNTIALADPGAIIYSGRQICLLEQVSPVETSPNELNVDRITAVLFMIGPDKDWGNDDLETCFSNIIILA